MSKIKQQLIWIPIGKPINEDSDIIKVDPIPYSGKKPQKLWTLFDELYSNKKPQLPYKPIYNINAYIESYVHDWDIRNNHLFYYSRNSNGGTWALLEF